MNGKYLIYFVFLYLSGFVKTFILDSHEDDVEILLENNVWRKMMQERPNIGVMDNGQLVVLSDIVSKCNDGKIVNKSNLKTKIRLYYTWISCIYSDRLKIILLFLKAVAERQKNVNIKWDAHNVLLSLTKVFKLSFSMIKNSLKLLTKWYNKNNKTDSKTMKNNHVEEVIGLFQTINERSNNLDEFIFHIDVINNVLDAFETENIIVNRLNSDEVLKNKMNRKIHEIIKSDYIPEDIIKNLQNGAKNFNTELIKEIQYYGFGFSKLLKSVYVKRNHKLYNGFRSIFPCIGA